MNTCAEGPPIQGKSSEQRQFALAIPLLQCNQTRRNYG